MICQGIHGSEVYRDYAVGWRYQNNHVRGDNSADNFAIQLAVHIQRVGVIMRRLLRRILLVGLWSS